VLAVRGSELHRPLDALGADEALGEPPDARGGRPEAVCLRPGHHGLGDRKDGLLLGQSRGAEHPMGELEELITGWLLGVCAAEQSL
jgi:hypothetical protein